MSRQGVPTAMSPVQGHPWTGAPPQPEPTRGQGLRSFGRGAARAIAVAVVLAAGVAGWFLADAVFLSDDERAADGVGQPMWPSAYIEPAAPWDSYEARVTTDAGDETNVVIASGLARVETAENVFEIDRGRGLRRLSDGRWAVMTAEEVDVVMTRWVADAEPMRLPELVPTALEPFATIIADSDRGEAPTTAVEGQRQIQLSVDLGAFARTSPIGADRWNRRHGRDPVGVETWTATVAAAGRLLDWRVGDTPHRGWTPASATLASASPGLTGIADHDDERVVGRFWRVDRTADGADAGSILIDLDNGFVQAWHDGGDSPAIESDQNVVYQEQDGAWTDATAELGDGVDGLAEFLVGQARPLRFDLAFPADAPHWVAAGEETVVDEHGREVRRILLRVDLTVSSADDLAIHREYDHLTDAILADDETFFVEVGADQLVTAIESIDGTSRWSWIRRAEPIASVSGIPGGR